MTDSTHTYFLCNICKEKIYYVVPAILIKDWDKDTNRFLFWSIPKQKKYYRAKARLEHNAKHTGPLDLYGESQYRGIK